MNLQIRQQIQPVRHALWRLGRLVDHLHQFPHRQIQAVIVSRIYDRQLLAYLRVERMLFQMLHIIRRQFFRIGFLRAQKFGGIQQADVLDTFRDGHRLPVMCRQQNLLCAAQMRKALRRRQ